jgi:hypothetical protein
MGLKQPFTDLLETTPGLGFQVFLGQQPSNTPMHMKKPACAGFFWLTKSTACYLASGVGLA